MNLKIMSVTQLNNYIKTVLDGNIVLANANVEGEVSNLKVKNGHMYFSIKDDGGRIDCVMFKSDVLKLEKTPEDGEMIVAKGRVSMYQRDGKVQLYVNSLALKGIGDLFVKFNELKEKLYKEGLFDEKLKRGIPTKPTKIAVITSPSGAAIRDIINVTRNRNKGQHLVIYPARVQGLEATNEVINALKEVNKQNDVDLIIIARGGGSIEDLWCFNSEALAHAIRESRIPVVTGIGHEIDTTIADLAADLRASTPSHAAEITVPDNESHILYVEEKVSRIKLLINQKMRSYKNEYILLKKVLERFNPSFILVNEMDRLDSLKTSLRTHIKSSLKDQMSRLELLNSRLYGSSPDEAIKLSREDVFRKRQRIMELSNRKHKLSLDSLNSMTELLKAYNPNNVLQKGYAIVKDDQGKVLSNVESIKNSNELYITVKDGTVHLNEE